MPKPFNFPPIRGSSSNPLSRWDGSCSTIRCVLNSPSGTASFLCGLLHGFLGSLLSRGLFRRRLLRDTFLNSLLYSAFLAALLTSAFFVTGLGASSAGVNALVTVAAAELRAVFREPATSCAIAKPYPTFSAAFSTIVFSVIFQVPSRCSFAATHCSGRPTQSYKSFSFPHSCWLLTFPHTVSGIRGKREFVTP